MGISERKERQRADRADRIVASARSVAEREGWEAVTIRRLADEIEYSQPVLYSHFENRNAIVAAVALQGFRDLATVLRQAAHPGVDARDALETVALAYLAFSRDHPALYQAMFTLPTGLRFADAATPSELKDAFAALAAVVAPSPDPGAATETLWAVLHGLAELERSGRIRAGGRTDRVAIVVRGFFGR